MATGTLKDWLEDRGFGFIQNDDGGSNIFIHVSALRDGFIAPEQVRPGDRLEFDIGPGHGGKSAATNVRRI